VRSASAPMVLAACLLIAGRDAGALTGNVVLVEGGRPEGRICQSQPSQSSQPVTQAPERPGRETAGGGGATGKVYAEKNISAGRKLGGVVRGDEVRDMIPAAAASTEGWGSTLIACVCTGLLGLIGYRLKRRCR